MAVTLNKDLVATDDPLAVDLAISMADQVAMLDKDTTQFTTMLMKLPESTASSFKEEWEEDWRKLVLYKLGYMLEHPSIPYAERYGVRTISREVFVTPQRLHARNPARGDEIV